MPRVIKDTIRASIQRAERMARREGALTHIKDTNGPDFLVDQRREFLGESFSQIADDRLAEKLLPQARVVIMMREARDRFIEEKTYLGELAHNLTDLYESLGFLEQDRLDTEQEGGRDLSPPSGPNGRETIWRNFAEAIRTDNRQEILRALQFLLIEIHSDFLHLDKELPPLPPRYRIPE